MHLDVGSLGVNAVRAGLAASVLAVVLYALALRGNRRTLVLARWAFTASAVAALFCFGALMWLVVGHHFEYRYVMDYTSADLEGPFLYAATWAGQQGSFLLWAVWTAIIGGLVAWKAGKWEARVMPFYTVSLTFLFGILLWLSPYALVERGTGANMYPPDLPWPPKIGFGLNPSLQNYWMAIHPPTIFFGFASLAVPFCYAVAAMLWKEYTSWAERVMPWVLLTVATLGVGLFMGGYWAYETQGWHGFWAWDPVENASLFPWLCALALVHGLVVQKSRGGMGRSNLFLAITGWLLFVYGTYLTRSGVLANFSVHAFVSLANSALVLLLVMIAVYGLLGYGLFLARIRSIPGRPISDKMLSRDTGMVIAVTIMAFTAAVVAFGTSWPLISKWSLLRSIPVLHSFYAAEGLKAEPIFYNKFGSAILVPSLFLMGVIPYLAWGKTNGEKVLSRILGPWFAALAVGGVCVAFVFGQTQQGVRPDTPPMLVVIVATLGAFALFSNMTLVVRLLRIRGTTAGGWLAHAGIALLFIGTLVANVYERTDTFVLTEGAAPHRTPFGYALQYGGWTHDPLLKRMSEANVDEVMRLNDQLRADWMRFDHALKLRVIPCDTKTSDAAIIMDPHAGLDEKRAFEARTPVFRLQPSQLSNQEGPTTMRWPAILKDWWRDFYVEVANDPEQMLAGATVNEGQSAPLEYAMEGQAPTGYSVRYKRFYMNGQPGQPGTVMGAVMEVTSPQGKRVEVRPGVQLGGANGPENVNVLIPELGGTVHLEGGVRPGSHTVRAVFLFQDLPSIWRVQVQVTQKPMINLVWLGVVLMGTGTLLAMARRSREARTAQEREVAPADARPDEPQPAGKKRRAAGAGAAKAAARR